MATVTNLKSHSNNWQCEDAPITLRLKLFICVSLSITIGTTTIGKLVVHRATVDLRGKVYELLRQEETGFLMDDVYTNPGPCADSKAVSLCVKDLDYNNM